MEKVEMAEEQKTIDLLLESKGIRLDVYVKDENNTIYNIEMQIAKEYRISEDQVKKYWNKNMRI